MIIRRSVKIQLVAFALISLLGIFYVGSNYVGIHFLSAGPYNVTLVLPQSGGIFTNAEVTERGVTVGRVGAMTVRPDGVHVQLQIDHGKEIPAAVHATVANLSAVGEQYVDLEPKNDGAPYLKGGSVIPARDATIPLDDATLLVDLDRLVNSVDRQHLTTVINELGRSFQDLGPSLQSLIDNGNALTEAAIQSLPQQLKLIDDGKTVLDTQNQVAGELKSWASTLSSFSDQLRVSDPKLRSILDAGVPAAHQLTTLLQANSSVLPSLLGNLVTFNGIQAVRLPYVRATLELFPAQTAGGFFVTPGDGTAHFGMVNDSSNPCTAGYGSTRIRGNNDKGSTPSDWAGPANLNAFCQASKATSVDNRGSRLTPRPDKTQTTNSDPYPGPQYGKSNHPTLSQQRSGYQGQGRGSSAGRSSTASGAAATPGSGETIVRLPYDPNTGLFTGMNGKRYQLGYSGPLAPIFGSSSWEWLLIAPTMR